jgi:kynurenine formamidase
MFVDLTHPFRGSMPTYPGDPAPTLAQIASIEKDGYADHLVTTTMHVGTHIDAPLHMIRGGKKITDYPPETFFGRGVFIDVRGKNVIDASCVDANLLQPNDIVLFYTGWSDQYGEADYFERYPDMTEALADALVRARVRMLGLDACSPDRPPYTIHKLLLSNDILIIENLTNLNQLLGKRFNVCAFPMNIDADAAPARVVADLT